MNTVFTKFKDRVAKRRSRVTSVAENVREKVSNTVENAATVTENVRQKVTNTVENAATVTENVRQKVANTVENAAAREIGGVVAVADCGKSVVQRIGDVVLTDDNSNANANKEGSISNDKAIGNWMIRARKYQQGNYNSLGDRVWDLIKDEEMLELKIGFALFGIPEGNSDADGPFNYSNEQKKYIHELKSQITNLWKSVVPNANDRLDGIYFSCVFVHLYLKNEEVKDGMDVLFRIPKNINNLENVNGSFFVDSNGRVYNGLNDYLNKNKLPKCYMCYPLNGMYSAEYDTVQICFKESPACKITETVLKGLDVTSTILTIGATGVGIAAIALAAPIAPPIVVGATITGVASCGYDASRYVRQLIDKKVHKESLSLKDPESRNAWIGLATSTVGAAVGGAAISRGLAISRGVIAGEQALSRAGVITLRVINVSSVAISGIGVINSLVTIVVKFLNGTLTKRDIHQFISACFFFLNAKVSYNVGNTLIQDVASSNDITSLFHTTKNTVYSFTKATMEFKTSSSYNMLKSLILGIQPRLMPNIDINTLETVIYRLIVLINSFSAGRISWPKFVFDLFEVLESIWFQFKDVIIKAIDELCELLTIKDWKRYVVKTGCKPFFNSNPDVPRQFCMALQKTVAHCNLDDTNEEYTKDILTLINELPSSSTENSADFLNKAKYVCEYVTKDFDSVKEKYELNMDLAKFNVGNNCKEFKNIEGNKNLHFFKATISKLCTESSLQEIVNSYSAFTKSLEQPLNDTILIETTVSSHYAFSGPVGSKVLTEQQYWQKANDITNANLNNDNAIILIQDGVVFIRPNCNNSDIKAIIFYSSYERNCVLGFMTVIKNDINSKE